MPGPIPRRAALLSLLFLCAAVESPPPARAAAGAPPKTMQGFLRVQIRGLTSVSGGFLAGMLAAQGMYFASVHRMMPGFFKILGGMAKFSKDPSIAEMNNFLRSQGPGIDLSTLPVSAARDVELQFTLEEVKKDEFRLKHGNVRWSAETYASVSSGDAEITDKYRGQGSAPLDPKTSSITYVTSGKKGLREAQLDVAVQFPAAVDGKSIWRSPVASISIELRGDKEIWETKTAFGFNNREVKDNPSRTGGVWFTKRGPPDRLRKGREVYQDLLDSGVLEEWELWSECEATIESPSNKEELVYDVGNPGRLLEKALAKVTPSFWENDLNWLLPEISGSELDPPRHKANGIDFDIIYTNLPEENSAFDFREVVAYFEDRANRAGCKNPERTKVGYFFPRMGINHGGPAGPKSPGNAYKLSPNPNWFHYWMQTKASVGLPSNFVRYGEGNDKHCINNVAFYDPGQDHIVVCDFRKTGFAGYNPLVPGFRPKGIDWFAQVLLHEREHFANYRLWWPNGYDPTLDTDPIDPGTGRKTRGDDIPDALESSLSAPPEVKAPRGAKFDPNMQDSFGYGIEDEHYFPWAAALRWAMGSANREDWSCPGKQGLTTKCRD